MKMMSGKSDLERLYVTEPGSTCSKQLGTALSTGRSKTIEVIYVLVVLMVCLVSFSIDLNAQKPTDPALLAKYSQASNLSDLASEQSKVVVSRAEAIKSYEAAARLFKETGSVAEQALVLTLAAHYASLLGQDTEALRFLEQSLPLFRAYGKLPKAEAQALDDIAGIFEKSDNSAKALQYYSLALPLHRLNSDSKREAKALYGIARSHDLLGDKTKALENYALVLPLWRQLENKTEESTTLTFMGHVWQERGDHSKAIEYYTQSLQLDRALLDKEGEGVVLGSLALSYEKLGDRKKAIENYLLELAINRELKDKPEEAATLRDLSKLFNDDGQVTKALEYALLEVLIWRETGAKKAEAVSLNRLANLYQSGNQHEKAIEHYDQSLKLRRELSDKKGEALVLGNLAKSYEKLGNHRRGIEHLLLELTIHRDLKSTSEEAKTLIDLSLAYNRDGQTQKSIEHAGLALQLRRQEGNRGSESQIINWIGSIFYEKGDYAKALEHFYQSLEIDRSLGEKKRESMLLGSIARAHEKKGERERAIEQFLLKLAIDRELKDKVNEASTLADLMSAYEAAGKSEKALEHAQLALVLRREQGNKDSESYILNRIGNIFYTTGDQAKAIEYYERSLAIERETSDKTGEAVVLANIAGSYSKQGDTQKAVRFLEQALKIFRELGNRNAEADTFSKIALAYSMAGNHRKAVEFYDQSQSVFRLLGEKNSEAIALGNLGASYESFDKGKALEHYVRSLTLSREVGNKAQEALMLNNVGVVHFENGDFQKAVESHQQALTVYRSSLDKDGEALSFENLGHAFVKLSNRQKAEESFVSALEILESTKNHETTYRVHFSLAEFLKDNGEFSKAISHFEKAREMARNLTDKVREGSVLVRIGESHRSLNENRTALDFYDRALAIFRATPDKDSVAVILTTMGAIHGELSDPINALKFLDQAVQLFNEIPNKANDTLLQNAYAFILMTRIYEKNGDTLKALRAQEQLADVHKIRGDKLGEAKALNNAGNLYFSIKNPKAALPYFERALGLFGELGDKNARIPTLHNLGATLVELGENEKALAYFQEVAQLSKVGGEKKIEADALFQIAFIQELNGERDQALSSYTLALGLRRQLGDKFGEGSALSGIGLIQYKKEEYRSALESFEAAGECYRVSGAKLPESLAIVNAGNAYYALEDGPKGRQKYAAALVRAKESGERSIEYDVLDRISKSFEEWGDMEGALQSAEAAHALFRSSTDKTAQMKAIYNVTRLQTDLGRYQQAAALLLEALKAASEAKEGEQEFRATRGLGFVYEIARDHQQALARYSEALALARTLGRQGEEAEMLLAVGRMNGKLGATQLGKEQMSQALKLFEAMEDDYYGKRFAHRSLALLFAGMRDLPNSIRQFELAKGGAQANYVFGAEKFVGLSALEVFAWAAALELRETDYRLNQSQLGADSALKKLERARMLYTNLDDLQGRIDTGLQISLLEAKLGAFEKSAAAANEALALSRQFPGLDNEASALLQLGALHAQLTQFPNAIESFEKALEHGRTQNSKSVIAKALSGIATVYSSLGEKELALRKVDEALNALGYAADLSNVKGSANVDVLMDIALVVHASEKDDKRAADFYLKIVELTEPSDGHLGDEHKEARARTRLADIIAARLKDKLDFALGTAEEALSIRRNLGDRAGEADTLNTIGLIETKLGKSKNAVAAYGRALAIFRTIKDTNGEGEVLGRLRDLSAAAGDRDLAIYFGKQSVDALQELRSRLQTLDIAAQKSYLRRVEGAFRSLAELLIGQGRLSEGLQVLRAFQDQGAFDADHSRPRTELWKNARELRLSGRYRDAFGVFAKTFVASPNSATRVSPTSNDSKEAKVPIGTLEEPLIKLFQDAKLEFSKSDADSQPPETLPELIALQKSISLLSQSSGENAVAVFQLAGAEALHVLIVTSKDIDCVSYAIPRDHLFAKAQQFWALLSSDKFDPTILGGELHEIIFRPIAGKIPKDTNTILWSLDGSLRYLPMGALYDGKSKQYLIERFNHVNLTRSDTERLTRPPAAKWTATAMGTSKPHRVSLFGDSILFNALPGVASEFEQLFGGIAGAKVLDGKVMRDGEFDRKSMIEELKLKRPVVHIASHFNFRPGDEARSFLLLGDGTAFTLADMKKQADMFAGVDLLTLSACNTAAQQADANGKEIDGFAELAQRLGANAVMATLWPVADASTPWLMREFYEGKLNRKLTKAESLRRAQLALLQGNYKSGPSISDRNASATLRKSVVIVNKEGKAAATTTRGIEVYVKEADAPPYQTDSAKPFAHPYYWSPFILFGNWQ